MKILMLGWEYPPHINGGLGTACQGLTAALSEQGIEIDFVLPHVHGDEQVEHMSLFSADARSSGSFTDKTSSIQTFKLKSFLKPYLRPNTRRMTAAQMASSLSSGNEFFAADLFGEVDRYANLIQANFGSQKYDLIHAHDWMTFPAATALANSTGAPLIAHVHSLEADRSGHGPDETIQFVERQGVHGADRIIAVSNYTKSKLISEYQADPSKVHVVHNGVELRTLPLKNIKRAEKQVLFLGRVTFQKGPDYFVRAAKLVSDRMPEVKFVLAGDGDMLPAVKQLARDLGIGDKISFPGFVTGSTVAKLYRESSVYVMPSVSEPFGIAPLEAISHETPVILSKQSGVSEVIRHALKIDFWDVPKLADYIENSLIFSELRNDLVSSSTREVKSLSWDRAGSKITDLYQNILS